MCILSARDEHTRLKSYSATVRGTASVIKIEIEAEQKARRAAKSKPRKAEAAQRLALPAPVRALPPPKGGEA